MPKRNIVKVQLPPVQPDCCAECPLLGVIPKQYRPHGSKETLVCLGTMDAMTPPFSRSRASTKDSKHPLRRPCDSRWIAWQTLPLRKLGISIQQYNECRLPYEQSLQMVFKFHRTNKEEV
jgi:hypothetical protein